ncbi:MAG: DNA mismatch repair protein MutS [Chloroflexota bacterium]|nr:DNA mismatch repair protein MutS [Chloroflexota bacterium]MDE2931442.1 DNA mismatch repair protein MutS [Chloroflexota bacterium]
MPKSSRSMTPIQEQYYRIKQNYPDALLFFRLGDFYELFGDDAKVASETLQIVLTAREFGKSRKMPMCGVPAHAAETYLGRLLAAGHRVAICEQVSEPGHGLVERAVVRVATPGTIVDPKLLAAKENTYVAAVIREKKRVGLAYADVSTGEFAATEIREDTDAVLAAELGRLKPAECVFPEGKSPQLPAPALTPYAAWHFELQEATSTLLRVLAVGTLDGFGCADLPLATRAAGGLLAYLEETQKSFLGGLDGLRTYALDSFMGLDPATLRNLEILRNSRTQQEQGSLLGVLDETRSAMGGRLLRQWLTQPLVDVPAIEARLNAVEALTQGQVLLERLREQLGKLADVERLAHRALQRLATPQDLARLGTSLEAAATVKGLLSAASAPPIQERGARLDPAPEVAALITSSISTEPGQSPIKQGYSAELDGLVQRVQEAQAFIANLEAKERHATGIKTLRVGHNKVYGYYLEVSKGALADVPERYMRKQTLTTGERYSTTELQDAESLILNAQEKLDALEQRIFAGIVESVAAEERRLRKLAGALAALDVFAAFARVAVRRDFVRPTVDAGDGIEISEGRHPVVEAMLDGAPFIPNDVKLDAEQQIIVLTGPNMAGKSTYLRQVALTVLMAQVGSFVAARSARVGIVDRIFTRVGAQDEIASGASTFMVEMTETSYILSHATPRSLVVFDEVGRGTSTYDGLAIARAVLEYLHNHSGLQSKTLFATHFHELAELEGTLPRVKNSRVDVLEEQGNVVFLHKVVPGGADRSYGVNVAKLAGLPRPVLRRAEQVLHELEERHLRGDTAVPSENGADQLPLFSGPHPVVSQLQALDVDAMTPLEAISTLYELKKQAKD